MITLPGVHPAQDQRIRHRVTHCERIDRQVDVLNIRMIQNLWIVVGQQKVDVIGEPGFFVEEKMKNLLSNQLITCRLQVAVIQG